MFRKFRKNKSIFSYLLLGMCMLILTQTVILAYEENLRVGTQLFYGVSDGDGRKDMSSGTAAADDKPHPLPRRERGRVTFGCIVVRLFTHILVLFYFCIIGMLSITQLFFSPLPTGEGLGERLSLLHDTNEYPAFRIAAPCMAG